MPLTYQYLSQDEMDDAVASAILQREREHHNYELNRVNYECILRRLNAELPEDWPDELRKYRGLYGEQLAAALDGLEYALACRLQFRDRVRILLATTCAEQQKTEEVYLALGEQLPDGERRLAAVQRTQLAEKARASLTLPEGFVRGVKGWVEALAAGVREALPLPSPSRNGCVESGVRRA